ncbi:MAG: glycosyl hydrolase, partial [bacterium]|nr:glycosyl hydrolase [bacterium]
MADRFDASVVYATFDNRKRDDFKPYVLKSSDKGNSWVSITSNLPENGTVHTLEQDPEVPGLLFAGTEFGFYFSIDGGKAWTKLTSGLPTIAVRDMAIQEQKNDLVLATFGRGFYILDDYIPLRELAMNKEILEKAWHIFPVDDALMYIQTGGKYGQGSTFYTSKNPDFGATVTYYLKEVPKTLKAERKEKEKELFKEKQPIPQPSREELRMEEAEEAPMLIFTIYDEDGNAIRKLNKKASKGVNRITWDLRYSSTRPVSASSSGSRGGSGGSGLLAMPGTYTVGIDMLEKGDVIAMVEPVSFDAKLLRHATLPAKDYKEVVAFQKEVSELSRVMNGAQRLAQEQENKLKAIKKALTQTPQAGTELGRKVFELEDLLSDILFAMNGPSAKASWEELSPMNMPLSRRLSAMTYTHWNSTSELSKTET